MSTPKFIKIFKAGTFKDSTGKEHTITTEELDRRVTLYNEQQEDAKRKAPHVIGHPTHNLPAYGWVGKLKREGQYLLASCEEMADSFVEAVNSKAYKFRSASFYGDGLLRHVGWLGAAQPAVPGLDEVSFTEDANMVLFEDFMDWDTAWNLNRAGELFQRFRDWIIEQSGLEVADRVMPQWNIDGLKNAKAEPTPEFNDPTPIKDNNMTELEKKLETLQSDFTQVQTELATVKAERDALKTANDAQAASFASLTTQVAQLSELNVRRDIENYCDKLIADKKMLPAEREFFVDDLTAKAKVSTSDFAEGTSPLDKTKAMLDARAPHSLFTEVATGDRAGAPAQTGQRMPSNVSFSEEGSELDEQIRKVMTEKNINYNEALELVSQEL